MAAQLIFTKGPSRRGLLKWMAPAIISLPVPDSPVMRTVASAGATWATVSRSRTMAGALPMRFRRSKRLPRLSFRRAFSSRRRRCSMARSIFRRSSSKSRGLGR